MNPVSAIIYAAFVLILVYLLLRLAVLRRLVSQLQEEQQAISSCRDSEQVELSQLLGKPPRPVVTIEIFNAVEVASNGSAFAKLLGKCAPNILCKQVYKHTASNLKKHMTEHGMHVEVQVRGLD